jgi:tight adherence protein C
MTSLFFSMCLAFGVVAVFSGLVKSQRLVLVDRVLKPIASPPLLRGQLSGVKEFWRARLASKSRLRSALFELPEILDMLAVSLNAGDGIFAALARVAPGAKGVLPSELQRMFISLELGAALDVELSSLGRRLPERQVLEFVSKLQVAMRRGSPLAQVLQEQAESARAEIRNYLLKRVGQNETRMLIPLVFLILPVTVLFAIYPSLQLINIGNL